MTTTALETGKAYLLDGPNQTMEAFKAAQDAGMTPVYVKVAPVADDEYTLADLYAVRGDLITAFTAAPKVAVVIDLHNTEPKHSLTHVLQQFLASSEGPQAGNIVIRDVDGAKQVDTSGVTVLLNNVKPEQLSEEVRAGFKPLNLTR
jgi:hypothetical protein